jgi:RimJ/RimL family protein N-acetyltransferase
MITIRHITKADAETVLNLCTQLDQETTFMMLEPGEREPVFEEQKQRIAAVVSKPNQTFLLAEDDSVPVGFLAAHGGLYRRDYNTAYIVVGVLQAYAGQGIGTRLFREVEKWAREQELHRLELTVMTHNKRAIHLYKKMGFEIEGTKRDSVCVDGTYIDEYYMAKLLTDS